MKMKPLHGRVTIRLLKDRAEKRNAVPLSSTIEYRCGVVVNVGCEDTVLFTNEEGPDFVQKVPFVVKPGDLVLFQLPLCQKWQFRGEVFYTIRQSDIEAIIEE